VHIPTIPVLPENADDNFILVLDGISDPGNLGTIIRIADWFGIRTVITSENTVDLFNPKVVHASMGSIARVEVIPADIPEFLSRMPGITGVFGAFMTGENIYSMDLPSSGIIIIGNESNGISPEVSNLVKTRMHIPSYAGPRKESFPESLNAAVATAIICSEFRRRNKQ
jgi:TrmH family RNA methyltransferase